jgi:hypothetical protein
MAACAAMLREVADYPISSERLADAWSLIEEMIAAIRTLDEVDVSNTEPVTVFRIAP